MSKDELTPSQDPNEDYDFAETSLVSEVDGLPPSVSGHGQLRDSYTWHSVDQRGLDSEDPAVSTRRSREYIMGIDEAGRGPVLGPQVYAVAYCPKSFDSTLRSLGFADSKTLNHETRVRLLRVICDPAAIDQEEEEVENELDWAVRVMSPFDLSKGMLRKNPYNLNAQSHDATVGLIADVVRKGFNLSHVYVDTVGQSESYQAYLSSQFPSIQFTVTSKADSKFPIVGAASICAKVTRDAWMENWRFEKSYQGKLGSMEEMGSGYPSDPKTKAWLADNFDPIFGYPNIARFSWSTIKDRFVPPSLASRPSAQKNKEMGISCRWNDEPPSIQRWFASTSAGKETRPAVMIDLGVNSVADL